MFCEEKVVTEVPLTFSTVIFSKISKNKIFMEKILALPSNLTGFQKYRKFCCACFSENTSWGGGVCLNLGNFPQ